MISTRNLSYRTHLIYFVRHDVCIFMKPFRRAWSPQKILSGRPMHKLLLEIHHLNSAQRDFSLSKCWCFSKLVKGRPNNRLATFVVRNCGRGSQARWLVALLYKHPVRQCLPAAFLFALATTLGNLVGRSQSWNCVLHVFNSSDTLHRFDNIHTIWLKMIDPKNGMIGIVESLLKMWFSCAP